MGVFVHILDRRTVQLNVAGKLQEIGTLRHVSKVTELDEQRVAELDEAADRNPSPLAAMVAQSSKFSLASASGVSVDAHRVIGWDEGRGSVTDIDWDYLPTLGYAIADQRHEVFELHELQDGALRQISPECAASLGLLGRDGILLRHGQPLISECVAVRSYISGYAEADCVLENGRRERLLLRIAEGNLPSPSWLIGRRPMDVQSFKLEENI